MTKIENRVWDLIREKVKIPDLINLDSDNHAICPFKGNTPPNRSFVYYPETESWSCFHPDCGGGTVIHLFQHLNGIPTYNEAIKNMAIQYKIPFGTVDQEQIEIEKEVHYIFIDFMVKCHNNPEFQNKYALIEMKKRGFTKKTLDNFNIGLFDNSIKKYMEKMYSNELLQNAGFKDFSKKDKEKKGKLYWKIGKRIVYPYLDQNNAPQYFIYRLIDSEPDFNKKAKYIKHLRTDFVREIPFGLNSIYILRKKTLIITEGLTDSISVAQANYPVLSPITVRIKKDDVEKMVNYCKRFETVVVINDNEEFKKNKNGEFENTGLKGSIDTLKVLIKHGINCSIGIIPNPEKLEKIDLDDYLKPDLTNVNDEDINIVVENSLEELEEKLTGIIKNYSTPGLDFLTNTINEKSTQNDLIEIIEILPEDNLIQEDTFKKLAKKRKVALDVIKKIYKQYQEDKDFKILKEQKKEKEKAKEVFEQDDNKQKEEKEEISAVVKESEDTVYEVICTKEKLIYRRTKTFYNQQTNKINTKILDTTIIDEPFRLKDIFINPNRERFYEVQIGEELDCYNKRDLLNFIENERNYGFVVGRQLKECVSVILREFEKTNRLEPKEMYFTLGVFTDKNDDLIVVHPDNKDVKIYGVNDYQKRTIERVKRKGLDMDGMLLNECFQLLHYPTFPENVRLTTLGHSLIANFFNVLRDDIDVFPSHFYLTPLKSVGKTALFELIYNDLYGTELKTNDDVDSPARFSENCTDTTTCMFIDDIDKLNPKVLNQIKTAGTTLKTKERMTKDQKIIIQETYRAFSGTGNSDEFISGDQNEALRGRCLISRDFTIVNDFKELKKLEDIKEIIKSNRIVGYFLLGKSIEYVNKTIDIDNISSHDKLIQLIRQNKEKLRKYFELKTIFDDPRRLTIYALLYTSWQMWNFVFQEAEMHSDLLEEILSYEKNNKLLEYIQKHEESVLQMNIDDVLNILEYYEGVKGNNGIIRYENINEVKVLDTQFVNYYDKWAKIHGYEPLKKLTKLGEMLSKVLKKDMNPKKSIRARQIGTLPNTPYKKIIYGIIFNERELYVKLGLKMEYNEEMYNEILEVFEDNNTNNLIVNDLIEVLNLNYEGKEIKKNINLMILNGKFTKTFDGETVIIKM